ncbi:response regulator transcription factor [Micromonospora sp. CA-111912]|uniref:response regulator transcription factor n=1 Tax=Micromonospora sp. CA-111912 TaxID=3239955 RepID=UPI003D931508
MTVDVPPRGLVLVVEDDPATADLVRLHLTWDGFGVHLERDGAVGLAAVRRLRPVVCVLDIALPGLAGTEICRRLREAGDRTPVIFLTTRDEVDRIVGLELGAEDHVAKPVSPRELIARVRVVLRRAAGAPGADERVRTVGPVTIDPTRRTVTVAGVPVQFTSTEFDLLAHLMARPGRVCTRAELLAGVWGYAVHAGTRTVDVHVAQIRAKLGGAAGVIRTHRGVGYAADADLRPRSGA